MAGEYKQKVFHLIDNTVITVDNKDCYLDWVKVAVKAGGTNWVIRLQDRAEDPPGTPAPNVFACGSYQSNQQDIATFFQAPEPVLFKNGMQIVPGGSAGELWVWIWGWFEKPGT